MNTRVESLRAGLAILTVIGLALAMIMVFGASAQAELVEGATTCDDAGFPEANKVEGGGTISNGWGSAVWEDDEDATLVVDMNPGWSVEICVKAGDDGVHVFTVSADTTLGPFGENGNGISHASWRNASQTTTTTTTEATTTTSEATTTTSEATTTTSEATTTTSEATTTTSEATTTTTEATTTSSIEDEVLGTVITSSTTVPDEVEGTTVEAEELPFTGLDSELLVGMAVLLLISGLMVLGLTGAREDA